MCAGLCLLALSYHFGAQSAQAQSGATLVNGAVCGNYCQTQYAYMSNGDVFETNDNGATWHLKGNVLAGGPVNVEQHTLGQLKDRFRSSPMPTTR